MIEVRHLSVGYGDKPVLQDVTAAFPEGKVTVLIGPNGSGKSTLLKAALGLINVEKNSVFYDDVALEKLPRRVVARKAALLAQSRTTASLPAERLVLHGRFPYLSYPRQYREADKSIAREAMERVGVTAFAKRLVSELSGGQRQSVYLAMLLAQQTETVFLDEPTTYLDIRHQLELMHWMRSLAHEGRAVVLVLHDLPLAMEVADRLLVLEEGRLLREGTPEEVYDSGILESVFGVRFAKLAGEDGNHYFCSRKGEE